MNNSLKINISDYTLDFEYAEKQSIVDSLLNNQSCISTLLGEENYYSSFMMIKYWKAGSNIDNDDERGVVGVLYNTGGYRPHITTIPAQPVFLLGFNESIVMYDMRKKALVFQCILPSPSFYCKPFKEGIVVLSELAVTEIAYSGEIKKTHTFHEILTDFHFSNKDFVYSLADDTSNQIIHLFS